jgi:hypothetical protein
MNCSFLRALLETWYVARARRYCVSHSRAAQAPKKAEGGAVPTNVLGPGALTVREGEHVFGVARILASFNDTFVCVHAHSVL